MGAVSSLFIDYRKIFIITLSFMIAFFLTMVPLPEWASAYRPLWLLLLVFYWGMVQPTIIGVGMSWSIGLIQDVMTGSMLGSHGLPLVVVCYLAMKLRRQLPFFPYWQQMTVLLFSSLVYLIIQLIIQGAVMSFTFHWRYWLPALVNALLWPWVYNLLESTEKKYKVS